ncbi:MAG TPA: diacylglycerol kinase family protein [Ohtaekwangia sp.]
MNNEVKKVLFIINKFAGTGFQPALEGRMIDTCARYDAECTIEFTQSRGHATELAERASSQGFDIVVAVGGDGTINEVAKGAIRNKMPMGIIPRGSGNGLARHLGIPLKVADGVESLFNSRVLNMDTFSINGKLSLNVSGIGFDGRIANLFGEKTRRGLAGYVSLTLKEYFTFKPFAAEIEIEGKILTKEPFVIAIANSSQYGNNARIAPQASVCDQLLHITLLKKIPPYRADFIYAFFTGQLTNSHFCEMIETPSLRIKTPHDVPYHVDGEPCGVRHEFNIEVMPAALPVLVPNTPSQHKRL